MQALEFWRRVVGEQPGILDPFIDCLKSNGIQYCVVDGQAVNAYVEPLVSLDLDVVVASKHFARLEFGDSPWVTIQC